MTAPRAAASEAFFAQHSDQLARLCHRMAERFARGGRLLATGGSPQARSDARHVAVEFVHPVIVGKRALPALALTADGGPLERQVDLTAEADDMLMAFDPQPPGAGGAGVALARERGCLTIAFQLADAEWELVPEVEDPLVAQELVETAYHVLWELVHVFFEHRGLLEGRKARTVHDSGASSFLYPFLGESETDLDAVLEDVRSTVLAKAAETDELATRTLDEGAPVISAAAAELRARLDRGGRLLALGNGGSATDAMDAVADMRWPPHGWQPRRALDLTEDTGVITAVGNDIGTDAIFARQVIAHGRPEDMLLAQTTSGNSTNVIEALAEARRQNMATVAMVGYDGGRIASDGLADFVVITRSQNIPRIQEAQASAWHRLRELVEGEPRPGADADIGEGVRA